jgi:hypothetical protein
MFVEWEVFTFWIWQEVWGHAHTKEIGLQKLILCIVKLHLHETSTVIADTEKAKCVH